MRRRLLPALLTLALVAAGCGDDESTTAETTAASTQTTTAQEQGEKTTRLFFTAGEQFETVERELPPGGSELTSAAEAVVEGPTRAEARSKAEPVSQIPPETEVVEPVQEEGGTATVEVSPQFVAGIPEEPARRSPAEEAELDARLGQLTYTLTQFPGVQRVRVEAAGRPVEPKPALERSDYARPEQGPERVLRKKGERGSSVRALQERLAELRYLPKRAVDGVQGYRTQQAVIAFQSWRGLERDGIVGPQTQAALAKASPPKPKADGPSKRIEVFREKGVALLISHGKVKRAIHVSTGGPGNETPTGSYEVFRKELRSWSVPFQVWLPYASYFNNGIAFHKYPDVPTYPASHGCVRVPAPEAKGLYRFAAMGTAVIVY